MKLFLVNDSIYYPVGDEFLVRLCSQKEFESLSVEDVLKYILCHQEEMLKRANDYEPSDITH